MSKILRLGRDLKDAADLPSILDAARDNGIARIVGTICGVPFELDRSSELAWLKNTAGSIVRAREQNAPHVTTRLDLPNGDKVYVEIDAQTCAIRRLDSEPNALPN